MKTTYFTILLIFLNINCFSQMLNISDTLNKYDNRNKRIGYWIEFLDTTLNVVNTEDQAILFRYAYYINDNLIWPITLNVNPKKYFYRSEVKKEHKRNLELMNGTYSLFYRKSKNIFAKYTYVNGRISTVYSYHSNGNLMEFVDYNNRYYNESNSFYYTYYNKRGRLKIEIYIINTGKRTFWKVVKKTASK